MTDAMIKPESLTALKNYMQADEHGVMAYVSRQALDEAIAALAASNQEAWVAALLNAPNPDAVRSFELKFSKQELAAIQELAEWHQISQQQALKQALRTYQLHEKRIRDGETFAWSGDKARAEEFAALAATPAVGGHMQRSELDDASNACLELCAKHGFATGHGDTVADMIREIDGQIATPAVGGEPVAWRVDGKREGLSQVWSYYEPEWPQIHAEYGDTVTPLYAAQGDAMRAALKAVSAPPEQPAEGKRS